MKLSLHAYALLLLATGATALPWCVAFTATSVLPGLFMLLVLVGCRITYQHFQMLRRGEI